MIRSRRYWRIVEPFQTEGETGEHKVVVSVEVFFRFVVNIDFQLGYFILSFCDDEEIVGWKDFELLSFVILEVLMKL